MPVTAEEKFVAEISGKRDRDSLHECIETHRAEGAYSYNLRRSVKRRRPYDIGGDETDSSGNLLYVNHTLQDDDKTTAEDLLQEWGKIPVSPVSADEAADDDDVYDHTKEGEEEEEDEDDDDCVSEASEDRVGEGECAPSVSEDDEEGE